MSEKKNRLVRISKMQANVDSIHDNLLKEWEKGIQGLLENLEQIVQSQNSAGFLNES